jgi:hypothetical protein
MRVSRHQSRDGGGPCPALVRVIGQALGHEQGAEVGITDAELAEPPGRGGDLLGRIVGVADEDLLGREDDLDRRLEPFHVEGTVLLEECEQIQTRQIAS